MGNTKKAVLLLYTHRFASGEEKNLELPTRVKNYVMDFDWPILGHMLILDMRA